MSQLCHIFFEKILTTYLLSTIVTPAGFKPTTFGTGIRRSIQLNYGAVTIHFRIL